MTAYAVGDLAALEERRGLAQVADAAVRAGADEDGVDRLAHERLAGLEVHVGERLLERAPLLGVGLVVRDGTRCR